jgi:hypothetical protein
MNTARDVIGAKKMSKWKAVISDITGSSVSSYRIFFVDTHNSKLRYRQPSQIFLIHAMNDEPPEK